MVVLATASEAATEAAGDVLYPSLSLPFCLSFFFLPSLSLTNFSPVPVSCREKQLFTYYYDAGVLYT